MEGKRGFFHGEESLNSFIPIIPNRKEEKAVEKTDSRTHTWLTVEVSGLNEDFPWDMEYG